MVLNPPVFCKTRRAEPDEADLNFGTFVHLQELSVSSEGQRLYGRLSPWEPVEDAHATRYRRLRFPLWDLSAAEV